MPMKALGMLILRSNHGNDNDNANDKKLCFLICYVSVLCSILYVTCLCTHLDRQEVLYCYTTTATQLHSYIATLCLSVHPPTQALGTV